jgi:hypothetical protein
MRRRRRFSSEAGRPIVYGVTGSVYPAFAIPSTPGLQAPLEYAPGLLLQLTYKVVWLIGVVPPLVAVAQFPGYAILHVVILAR